jgi:hypothetical protein
MTRPRHHRVRVGVAAFVLLATACGSSNSSDAQAGPVSTVAPAPPVSGAATRPQGAALFDAFQKTVDRSGPYSSLGAFCTPTSAPTEARRATDPGITADSIIVTHLRTKLEELQSIGFGLPVGDVRDIVDTFVGIVNDKCGGVNGRKLAVNTLEVSPLSPTVDADRVAACKQSTEQLHAVFAINSSGLTGPGVSCFSAEHDTILITTDGQSDAAYAASKGRLYSVSFGADEQLRLMARELGKAKVLEGRRIAIVQSDQPGQPETIKNGLIDVLKNEFGITPTRVDTIKCTGSRCADGLVESAEGVAKDRIDVVFPLLNVLSLPGYVEALAKAGVQPGAVKIYNTDFNNQASEIVVSKISELGGPESGKLYNDATLLDDSPGGAYRLNNFQTGAFSEMCNREYAANSKKVTKAYNPKDESETNAYGMVGTVCTELRMLLRGAYLAGPNPTRADLAAAMQKLGPVDLNYGIPGSVGPNKYSAPDAITSIRYQYPCPTPTKSASQSCIVPLAPTRSVER